MINYRKLFYENVSNNIFLRIPITYSYCLDFCSLICIEKFNGVYYRIITKKELHITPSKCSTSRVCQNIQLLFLRAFIKYLRSRVCMCVSIFH